MNRLGEVRVSRSHVSSRWLDRLVAEALRRAAISSGARTSIDPSDVGACRASRLDTSSPPGDRRFTTHTLTSVSPPLSVLERETKDLDREAAELEREATDLGHEAMVIDGEATEPM